jgi:hypothetical protein
VLFLGSGEVGTTGGAWSSTPPTIAAAEVRAVHLNLCAFAHRLGRPHRHESGQHYRAAYFTEEIYKVAGSTS